jgi:hypothetical protein
MIAIVNRWSELLRLSCLWLSTASYIWTPLNIPTRCVVLYQRADEILR